MSATLLIALLPALACKVEEKRYPADVRDNFLASCTASGGSDDQCRCALEGLEDAFTLQEFINFEANLTNGADAAEVQAIIDRCLDDEGG